MPSVKNTKVLFMGTPLFAAPSLDKLITEGYSIVGVVTQPDKPTGRDKTLTPPPIKQLAGKHRLPVFQFTKLNTEAIQTIVELKPDVIVLVAFGQLLPPALLDIPKFGVINLHPSLLPAYRGPAPIQTAILNGEKRTGLSLMLLDAEMDHGPILAQKTFDILEDDTTESLTNSLACEGAEFLAAVLPQYLRGETKPQTQDHSVATYTRRLTRQDAQINWQDPAEKIYNQVRAYYPWPGAWVYSAGKVVKILKTHLDAGELIIDTVQPEGKQPMSYNDYLNGHQPLV
ncbi:methionyl-tRNA formyltransferase [Candidatus Falkowbacteria bacterium]|nr:methionyl-tRNA formyltransferase [Candidatus Falkowbacteria bacterium]